MRTLAKMLFAVSLLLGVSSASAEGWTEFKTLGGGWELRYTRVMEFYLNPANLSDTGYVSVAEAEKDIKAGLAYWTNITGSDVQFVYKGLSDKSCTDLSDGINLFCFALSLTGLCTDVLASACPKMRYNGLPGKFWQELTIWIQLLPDGSGILDGAGHELGHLLGLDDHLPAPSMVGDGRLWREGMPAFAYDAAYARARYREPVFAISDTNRIDLPCVKYSDAAFYDAAVILHYKETKPGFFEPDFFKVVKASKYQAVPNPVPENCIFFQEQKILRINTILNGKQIEFETEIDVPNLKLNILKYTTVE